MAGTPASVLAQVRDVDECALAEPHLREQDANVSDVSQPTVAVGHGRYYCALTTDSTSPASPSSPASPDLPPAASPTSPPTHPDLHSVATDSAMCGAPIKRGPGRPRKVLSVPDEAVPPDDNVMRTKRPRGRPRNNDPTIVLSSPTRSIEPTVSARTKRTQGRPKKAVVYVNLTPSPRRSRAHLASAGERAAVYSVAAASGLLTPTPSKAKSKGLHYSQILEFFGVQSVAADFLRRHLPPRYLRESSAFWDTDSSGEADRVNQQLTVMRYYREVMFAVARSLCETDGAAVASIKNFAMWLTPDLTRKTDQAVARSCLRAMSTARKGSVERCVIRATLCGTFPYRDLQNLAQARQERFSQPTYRDSCADFVTLLERGALPKLKLTRQKFNPKTVEKAISFILAYENVSYLSWGTKKIEVDDKSHDVPSILRKKPVSVMYDQYIAVLPERPVSRASFYRLCSALTNGEVKARRAVDYVTGFLVYDTFDTLRDIICRVIPSHAKVLLPKLDVAEAWLKYGHASKRATVQECPRHDLLFGLGYSPRPSTDEGKQACCRECLSLDQLLKVIMHLVAAANVHESAVRVVKDITHKLELFMAHRLRVINQQRAISRMVQSAHEDCINSGSSDVAIVLIDFKMKAEPRYFREKTADHYGKRGMSWHGVQVRSWEAKEQEEGIGRAVRENVLYYDHLSSGDNRQDKGAVLSLLEATMLAIRRDLPWIKRIIVQSDNASCYQNAAVMLLLPVVGHVHGICVERYIHTETQDGKSPLDGHFGQAGRKVDRHLKQGNNCATPSQYQVALAADGGLPNCVAEVVHYDRPCVDELIEQLAALETSYLNIVGRANDVLYEFPSDAYDSKTSFKLQECPSYILRVFAYSEIGAGATIKVSPKDSICALHLDHDSDNIDVLVGDGADAADVDVCSSRFGADSSEDHGLVTSIENGSVGGNEYLNVRDVDLERTGDDGDDESEGDSECLDEESRDLEQQVGCRQTTERRQGLIGPMTGVMVATDAQVQRRARKWKRYVNAQVVDHDECSESDEDIAVTARDLVSFCKRRLLSLQATNDFGIVDEGCIPEQMAGIASSLSTLIRMCGLAQDDALPILLRGWARRAQRGNMYGEKYLEPFLDDIRAMFTRGAEDSADKLGAARMLEKLKEVYPHRFDLPGENDIRTEISRLFNETRKRKRGGPEVPRPAKRTKIPHHFVQYLDNLLTDSPSLKPQVALAMFREHFPESSELISDQKLKSKISSVKRKLKVRPPFLY